VRKPDIRLLATDLDGTVIGHRDDRACYPIFKDLIGELRRNRHLLWIISTGRHYGSFLSFTGSLERAGIHADLVVTHRGRVFERHGKGYQLKLAYTARVVLASMLGHTRARRELRRMHHHLSTHVRGVRRVLLLKDRFVLRFATLESAQESMKWVRRQTQEVPALKAIRKEREIEVEQIACRRGHAVRVLAERLGVSRDEILAVGDTRTDMCMLDQRVAFYTGCPLNADDETKQIVHDLGGHISTEFTLSGLIDIIRSTLDGNVSSEIPPLPEEMPRRRRSGHQVSRTGSRDRKHLLRSYMLGGAIVAITLVVFASFGVLPFSGLIMKPFYLFFRAMDGFWALFS